MAKSKNDPKARGKKQEILWNGKAVRPVYFIGNGRKYQAVAYESDGELVYANSGDTNPITWKSIRG